MAAAYTRRAQPRADPLSAGLFSFEHVLASFSTKGYRAAMASPDHDNLSPASRHDVETCLSLGLTSGRALARSQAAEVTAKVVAERLVAHLEASGFVVMRKPIPKWARWRQSRREDSRTLGRKAAKQHRRHRRGNHGSQPLAHHGPPPRPPVHLLVTGGEMVEPDFHLISANFGEMQPIGEIRNKFLMRLQGAIYGLQHPHALSKRLAFMLLDFRL